MKAVFVLILGFGIGSVAKADAVGNCEYAAHLATTAAHMVGIEGQTISEPSDGVNVVPSKKYQVKLVKAQKLKGKVKEVYKGEVENTGMDPVATITYEFSDGICDLRSIVMAN